VKLTVKVAIIIAVIIIPSTVLFLTLDTGMQDTSIDDSMELSGEIKIGAILPLTGDLSSHGEENLEGTKLGVADFNEYLAELEEEWSIKLVVEDSATSPVIALEKITTLNSKGISIVIGPETSANIRNIKGYSDSNNMLIVSCCSTAPSLAIPNDSVYRLLPDDSKQGTALGRLLEHEGIQVMIPVYRADTWGDGLSETTINSFEGRGGQVGEGIRYNPESPEFSAKTSLLAQEVQKHVDDHGPEKVAVLFLGFGEIVEFLNSASEHDVLDDVRWFGPGANTREPKIVDDPIGLEFATNVQFTTVQVAVSDNEIYRHVQDHVFGVLGRAPSTYVHTSYDAPWIVGLAMLETQSTDVDMIKRILPRIAENFDGATGGMEGIILNDAGDRGQADYDIWGIRNGEWVLLGKYTQSNDSVVLTGS
jgi:branched-chain amino acid transport system substrate-binding protein